MIIQLPRTAGCVVCGRDNPHGLRLTSSVDTETGVVSTTFTPAEHHIGFQGVVHGGVLATVLDEAMVWAAIWHGKRLCLAGQLEVRYRAPGKVGRALRVEARVVSARARLMLTSGSLHDGTEIVAEATGKYVSLPTDQNQEFLDSFVEEPAALEALRALKAG